MPTFETVLFDYFNNIKNYIRAQPLFLGGVASSGGGAGGPPGGFVGMLPQNRISYDLSEAATDYTPISGYTLVDNLNHIRYRIQALESGSSILIIKDSGVVVSSGVTVIDFIGATVEEVSPGYVQVTTSGGSGGPGHTHVFGETITGSGTMFSTLYKYNTGTLIVFYNGLRQNKLYYTEDLNQQNFSTSFVVYSDDELIADYILYE